METYFKYQVFSASEMLLSVNQDGSFKKSEKEMNKKIAIALIAIIAVSSLSVAASFANAMPWMGPRNLLNRIAEARMSNGLTQRSWVRINGVITQWGTTDVNGFLQTQARTAIFDTSDTRQLAASGAIWTTNTSRPISGVRAKENFTYTFYAARLTNASVSSLTYGTDNFFINGTWNVYKISSNVTITTNSNGDITNIHRESDTSVTKAYGELNVTDNWTKFTLAITGYDPLTGSVSRTRTGMMQFNPFKITDSDQASQSDVVTKTDLVACAKNYRAMPGWGNYDQRMDFNNNFKIDIADLATVAANMQ